MFNTIENIIDSLRCFIVLGCFGNKNNKLPKEGYEVYYQLESTIDHLPEFLKSRETPPPIIYDLTVELEEAKSYLYKFSDGGMLKYIIDKWLFYIYDKYPSLKNITTQEQHITTANPQPTPLEKGHQEPKEESLKDYFLVPDDQKNKLLDKLHTLLDGKKGKYVALVFLVCVENGIMSKKPSFKILEQTFGDIGNRTGYSKYSNIPLSGYDQTEINGIEKHIKPFKPFIDIN